MFELKKMKKKVAEAILDDRIIELLGRLIKSTSSNGLDVAVNRIFEKEQMSLELSNL